ncbi:MAG: anti-sigma-factor antagonist domain protein, partial [Mycobacterium sp.]|nr:anti-sigma-factor antagonist domain protein [Mycobacterium sp.]
AGLPDALVDELRLAVGEACARAVGVNAQHAPDARVVVSVTDDVTGLGVLVGGLKRVRAHEGSLRLVCTQERILKIFRITGLTKVFPIHASVAEALSASD